MKNFFSFLKALKLKFSALPNCPFDKKPCAHYDGMLCNSDCEAWDSTKKVKF